MLVDWIVLKVKVFQVKVKDLCTTASAAMFVYMDLHYMYDLESNRS